MSYGSDEYHNTIADEYAIARERNDERELIQMKLVAGIRLLYADLQEQHCFRFGGKENPAMKLEVILDAARDVCGDMEI